MWLKALETPLDHLRDGRQSRYKNGNQDQNAVPDYRWSKVSARYAGLQRYVEGKATTYFRHWHSVLSQWCQKMTISFRNSHQPKRENRKDLEPLLSLQSRGYPSEGNRETRQSHVEIYAKNRDNQPAILLLLR